VERLWQRYSQAAVQLATNPARKAACLERLRQHVAQMKAVVG
jgi:hypothetical protein